MDIISPSILGNLSVGTSVKGLILVRDYQIKQTKNGQDYVEGTLCSGQDMAFKVWSAPNGVVVKMKANDHRMKVCYIEGKLDEYNGVKSLNLTACDIANGVDMLPFLPVKYNRDAYIKLAVDLFQTKLSPTGINLINILFFDNTEVFNRFVTEFCAKSHHDNCLNGLLVHSYKVLNIVSFAIDNYSFLSTFPSRELSTPSYRSDLLLIGAWIHDWGKIQEMLYGVYQPNSAVTHRFFGVEMLMPFKDKIIELYDEKWYYDLVSIITQHHGEFGEDCKTIYAEVVHLADMLDTMLTGLGDTIENKLNNDSSGAFIYLDSKRLNL